MNELFSFPTLTTVILALAIGYSQYRLRSSEAGKEALENYKTLTEQLKEKIESLESNFETYKAGVDTMEKSLIAKIANLEGQNLEKDKQLKLLNEILANRNPELVTILNEIKNFLQKLNAGQMQNKEILDYQTRILEEGPNPPQKL